LSYRLKLFAFCVCALAALLAFNVGYSALNTLSRLDVVEAERDRWQRPSEVIKALGLQPGDVVADIGCGSGYFAVRLSPVVGKNGRVLAEDIRRLPLTFLWIRTFQKNEHNVDVLYGNPSDPRLLVGRVNAVLIANTYHELAQPSVIVEHAFESLAPGGRLVVLDRAPNQADAGISGLAEHEISSARVEADLQKAHFNIVSLQNRFIERDPDGEAWWLIVARKS
jgi:predicted methyltransferase